MAAIASVSAGPAFAAEMLMKPNGTYTVGVDIEPGRYEWSGIQYRDQLTGEMQQCKWERIGHGPDGKLVTRATGTGFGVILDGLVIARDDVAFVTTDCNGWKRVGDAPELPAPGSLGFLGS
ncbi:hypothetical protein [Prescottella agglutinans]|uniref:hypothetical protein n=1 Tax=Prescottella agglutinans TaxID=1644129 RepID=UPI0024748062|nr:hypothetical protein [Prescottella agglutinans]